MCILASFANADLVDMIGILPNVVIISICGCVLAIWVTFNPQDPPEPRRLKTN